MKRDSTALNQAVLFCVIVTLLRLSNYTFANEHPEIFDSHLHVVSPENWQESPLGIHGVIDGSIGTKEVVKLLNETKVGRAVLISAGYFFHDREKTRHENEFVADQVRQHPDRFVGLCSVSVIQPWALEELEFCVNSLRLDGLKIHLIADNMDISNVEHMALLDGIFKKATSLREGFPVLMDYNWLDDKQTLIVTQLAMSNPNTNIILAHGLGHHFYELMGLSLNRELFEGVLDNLYIDISASMFMYPPDAPAFENYIWHLRRFGTDRILFGSDFPAKTPHESYDQFMTMGFTPDEQQQILGGNLKKVYNLQDLQE